MNDRTDPALRRFRRLLRVYPSAYRARYGAELEAFFLRERAEGGHGARFWLRQTIDHVRAAAAIRRRTRPMGRGGVMGEWWMEIRLAVRGLVRAPTYTVFTVLTVALGIAATTAAFTVLDRVVLQPLPYPDSDRMVILGSEFPHDPGGLGPLSPQQLLDLMDDPGPAEVVTGVTYERRTILGMGDPERFQVRKIGTGFFELLGARPHIGRLIDDADQTPGAAPVTVLGFGLWMDRFGGDPEAVGRTLAIDGEAHTIVGVLSEEFVRPDAVSTDGSIWAAARFEEGRTSSGAFGITAFARLPDGVGIEAMGDYVDARFTQQHSFLLGGVARDYRAHEVGEVAGRLRSALGGVALLLLIALVNVASLMLTRTRAKERELSVRAALGAGRARLLRGLLTEAGVLTVTGGILAAALATAAVDVFRAQAPSGIPRLAEVTMDTSGLVVVAALTLLVTVTAGFIPAVWAARNALSGPVSGSRGEVSRHGDRRARGVLVFAETALAVVLVVGSGLLANDLIRLSAEDRGFDSTAVTTMRVDLAGRYRERATIADVWTNVLDATQTLPDVSDAALTSVLPYDGVSTMQSFIPEGDSEESFIVTVTVSADYFDVMGIPVVDGRVLTEAEIERAEPLVMVNEAFVRTYWNGEGGVGRIVSEEGPDEVDFLNYTVVGVVGDLRTRPGESAPPQLFFGIRTAPRADMAIVVRSEAGAAPIEALRQTVWALEPNLPIGRIATVESIARGRLDRPLFYATLFGGFAALALLLALVGVYGTTAYVTRSRAREIGIRLVMGARREEVVRGVLRSTAVIVGAGVVVGLIAAAAASRTMSEVLLYVRPRDVLTYLGVGGLVVISGILAAAQPALRYARVDPASTLREE